MEQKVQVRVRDENMARTDATETFLQLNGGVLTARDFIAERVRNECDSDHVVRPLVSPEVMECRIDGSRIHRRADADRHIPSAMRAFRNNAFIMLADGRQVTTLDEPINLTADSEVTFLRLTPEIQI